MSTPAPSSKAEAPAPAATISSTDTKELQNLDEEMKRIANTGLLEAPYLLSVPSDAPYTLRAGHRWNWMANTPFDASEEQFQYLTFIYRDPAHSLFALQANYDQPSKSPLPAANGVASGTNTPLHSSGAKKKISLSAYKNKAKQASQPAAKSEADPVPSGGVQTVDPAALKEQLKHTSQPAEPRGTKRAMEESEGDHVPRHDAPKDTKSDSKKPRVTPPLHQQTPKSSQPPKEPVVSNGAPEKSSTINHKRTPPRTATTNTSTISTKPRKIELPSLFPLTPPPTDTMPPLLSANLDNLNYKNRISDPSTLRAPLSKSHRSQANGLVSDEEAFTARMLPTILQQGSTKAPHENHTSEDNDKAQDLHRSKVVKLKFSKARRKAVTQLLSMRPQRRLGLEPHLNNERTRSDSEESGIVVARRRPAGLASDEKKRAREDEAEDDKHVKRIRSDTLVSGSQEGHLPKVRPGVAGTGAQGHKRSLSAQQKDDKSSALHNLNGVRTPQAPVGTPLAPSSSEHHRHVRTPSSGDKSTIAAANRWVAESKRLFDIARVLKHKMQENTVPAGPQEAKDAALTRQKLGAMQGLESFLAFLLHFSAIDQERTLRGVPSMGVQKTWRTLVPLWSVVRRACKDFPHLNGMCHILGAAYRAKIATAEAAQHSGSTSSTALAALASSPSSPPAATPPKLAEVMENLDQLRRMSTAAEILLPAHTLADKYPKTYAARPGAVTGFLVRPSRLAKMTTAFLGEWGALNRAAWKLQLEPGIWEEL